VQSATPFSSAGWPPAISPHWYWGTRSETVYWVAADLDGPKKRYILGTWSVLRSLDDPGLTWVADDRVAKVSDLGADVPLKLFGSLPDDGWNEAQDCLMTAGR
jgi:hypothetical protein